MLRSALSLDRRGGICYIYFKFEAYEIEGEPMAAQNRQDMGSGPVKPLLLQLMIPAVVAQVVNLLYNVVDRIYIGIKYNFICLQNNIYCRK